MESKICTQCGRQLPISQFKKVHNKSGTSYRSICHQCAYNNNKFNILSKERKVRQLSDKESNTYDMLLQLFDIYYEMGNTIGSGEYNALRNNKRMVTLEEQLAQAQALLSTKREAKSNDAYITEAPSVATVDKDLSFWFDSSFDDWNAKCYKPSYLRAIFTSLKKDAPTDEYKKAVEVLFSKAWDYEEYLANMYSTADLPDWLEGEELIV